MKRLSKLGILGIVFFASLILIMGCQIIGPGNDLSYQIPDGSLQDALAKALSKDFKQVTQTDLSGLQKLDASNRGIMQLNGIALCSNLQDLDVSGNNIYELNPLQGMYRSEERRVGKECTPTCRSRWSPYH
jgi:hypothetical protein